MTQASDWAGKEILLSDLCQLYRDLAGQWLLLEILTGEANQSATRIRLHTHHADKDKLHEWMLEHNDWDWSKRYLFVQADPEKPCDLGSS